MRNDTAGAAVSARRVPQGPLAGINNHTETLSTRLARRSDRSAGPDGCWLWLGVIQANGYGGISVKDRYRLVHRVAYEHARGPIPCGLVIDHLCRNRRCINPAHMEAVTHRENLLRGIGPQARNHRKTHCKRGHALSGDNLIVSVGHTGHPRRACRICRAAIEKARAGR